MKRKNVKIIYEKSYWNHIRVRVSHYYKGPAIVYDSSYFYYKRIKKKKRNSPDNMPQHELNRPIESSRKMKPNLTKKNWYKTKKSKKENQRNSPDGMSQHKWIVSFRILPKDEAKSRR